MNNKMLSNFNYVNYVLRFESPNIYMLLSPPVMRRRVLKNVVNSLVMLSLEKLSDVCLVLSFVFVRLCVIFSFFLGIY